MTSDAIAPLEPPSLDHYKLGYRPGLDGIRAVAIGVVLVFHFIGGLDPRRMASPLSFPGGFWGVDLFFVLSGFLITSLLLEEKQRRGAISYTGFYRRRAYRLLPALFAMLLVQLIYTIVYGDPLAKNIENLLPGMFYYANWWQALGHPLAFGTGQTWSLSVEEQFYFFWPVLLVAILHFRTRARVIAPFVALILVAVVSRGLIFHFSDNNWPATYVQTETRLDGLMFGALFSYLLHTGWRPGTWAKPLGYLGAAFLALMLFTTHAYDHWLFYGGYTLIAVACLAFLNLALDETTLVNRILSWKPIRLIGLRAYSIYIWHLIVIQAVFRSMRPGHVDRRFVVAAIFIALASEVSYRFIEKPFLIIKDRPRKTDAAGASGSVRGAPAGG